MPGRAQPRRRGEPPTKSPSRPEAAEPPRRFDWLRLAKRLPLAFLPALVVWVALAPLYNRLLTHAAESTLRLFESPDHSTLYVRDNGWMMVTRNDLGGGQASLDEIRLADLHFNFILWSAFAFATPSVGRAERLKRWLMGNVLLATFHVLLAVLAVAFVFATQLGDWSLAALRCLRPQRHRPVQAHRRPSAQARHAPGALGGAFRSAGQQTCLTGGGQRPPASSNQSTRSCGPGYL